MPGGVAGLALAVGIRRRIGLIPVAEIDRQLADVVADRSYPVAPERQLRDRGQRPGAVHPIDMAGAQAIVVREEILDAADVAQRILGLRPAVGRIALARLRQSRPATARVRVFGELPERPLKRLAACERARLVGDRRRPLEGQRQDIELPVALLACGLRIIHDRPAAPIEHATAELIARVLGPRHHRRARTVDHRNEAVAIEVEPPQAADEEAYALAHQVALPVHQPHLARRPVQGHVVDARLQHVLPHQLNRDVALGAGIGLGRGHRRQRPRRRIEETLRRGRVSARSAEIFDEAAVFRLLLAPRPAGGHEPLELRIEHPQVGFGEVQAVKEAFQRLADLDESAKAAQARKERRPVVLQREIGIGRRHQLIIGRQPGLRIAVDQDRRPLHGVEQVTVKIGEEAEAMLPWQQLLDHLEFDPVGPHPIEGSSGSPRIRLDPAPTVSRWASRLST